MSAFEQLQRQLVSSVAERRRGGAPAAARELRRWWRRRRGRGGAPAAIALVLLALLALATFVPHAGVSSRARVSSGLTASVAESSCPPCAAAAGRLHAPLGAEAAMGSLAARRFAAQARAARGFAFMRWTPSLEVRAQGAGASEG